MTDTTNKGPWAREDATPEVRAAKVVKERIGIVRATFTIILICFLCGLLLGSCAAGIYLPVKFVGWLFG